MLASPTILSCLRESVRRFPERPAVSDVERTVTYCELWHEVERYAEQLGARGDGRERTNLVEARSTISFAVAAIGTYLAGWVFVPYAKNAPAAVVDRVVKGSGAVSGSDIAEVLYTTGTTGAAKGVMLSSHAVWAAADNNRLADRITEESVYLIASPLDHISALRKLEACLIAGAHAVLLDGFIDVRRFYETIDEHGVNSLLLPPAAVMLLILASRDRLHLLRDRIRVVHTNGAPMTEMVKESLHRCLPRTQLVFAYGATEAGSACCAYDYAEFKGRANCVGKASPHAELSVEDGCIVLGGEAVMTGYLNDPVRTAEVLRDGKFYTNDLGWIDADGFVYVFGRRDDVINCGGMKVSPTEVEEVAMRYSGIADCACFGVDDSLTGSAVKLVVVPQDGSLLDIVDFRGFLRNRLERHQLPTQIACVTEIPKVNGKPDRKALRLMPSAHDCRR